MAEEITAQPVVAEFDAGKFLSQRNAADQLKREGKEAPKVAVEEPKPLPGKPEEVKVEAKSAEVETEQHVSRSERRKEKQYLREIGELRGELTILKQLMTRPPSEGQDPLKKADAEPQRVDFRDEAEFNRALGRWEAKQEARRAVAEISEEDRTAVQQREFNQRVVEMSAKCLADRNEIEDWDQWQKTAIESDEQPDFVLVDHPTLNALLGTSDQQARLLRYWAEHPKSLIQMLELSQNPSEQIQRFRRLEGKVEDMFVKKAAQAEPQKAEDRAHLAEVASKEETGRTAVDRDVHKPRPSTEVAARGGSPALSEPPIGSREWMQSRNRAQYGR